ncbi:MAG TPA: sterol desaturase family protein [Flavisolibacter sp.]
MQLSTILFTPASLIFILLAIEIWLDHKDRKHSYRFKDTVTSTVIGVVCISSNYLLRGLVFYLLVKVEAQSLFDFGNNWFPWIILFLLTDLVHYTMHWLEHKSRILWALHMMHHSSECYNLSVALRTPLASNLYRLIYIAPLCLIGFDATMVMTVDVIIILYGFILHTNRIKKLGWIEYVFNTPSHHRVHHASNEKYIDKNFGTLLIIWDKLFGTFQAEEEKPVYGLTIPIASDNLYQVVFHEINAMKKDWGQARDLKEKINYTFNSPGWKPTKASS